MSLEGILEDREERRQHEAADEAKTRAAWTLVGADAAERLIAFDRWTKIQLEKRLTWPTDAGAREKRIHQCRVELEHMLTQLYSRGWLLDGARLAKHVTTVLDAIGKAQRAGQVKDFWPYFKASVTRYVGAHAEELQDESKRAGNVMAGVLGALGMTHDNSIVTLIATRRDEINTSKTTLREKISTAKALKASSKADAEQLPLLLKSPEGFQTYGKTLVFARIFPKPDRPAR